MHRARTYRPAKERAMTKNFLHNGSPMQPTPMRCGASVAPPLSAALSRIGNGPQRDRILAGKARA
jgi:hypothetical protein